ncbi:MAG: antitoxin [Streptosporangiales bacterium]|nr:antitoxin [Streptosporangiales bacterium]
MRDAEGWCGSRELETCVERTLQVRGLDEDTVAELKARAARARMSLSAYVAQILTDMAATPAPDEIRERLTALQEVGGGASREDILAEIRRAREF